MIPRRFQLLVCAAFWAGAAAAHDFKAGDLRIDHPYATPSRPGMTTGAVYFRGIRNTGVLADRLLSASTPVAGRVEIHRMQMQGDVMQMRAASAVDLPAGATVGMKHGTPDGYHLMLQELKGPLKDGDHFLVKLRFEKAGTHELEVWVQSPRNLAAADSAHHH